MQRKACDLASFGSSLHPTNALDDSCSLQNRLHPSLQLQEQGQTSRALRSGFLWLQSLLENQTVQPPAWLVKKVAIQSVAANAPIRCVVFFMRSVSPVVGIAKTILK